MDDDDSRFGVGECLVSLVAGLALYIAAEVLRTEAQTAYDRTRDFLNDSYLNRLERAMGEKP